MSQRNFTNTELVFPGGGLMEASRTVILETRGYTRIGITLYAASNTHVGTIAVYATDDGTNWTVVPLDNGGSGNWYWSSPYGAQNIAVSSGSAFNAVIDLDLAALQIKVFYNYTSGTGTLTGSATLKG